MPRYFVSGTQYTRMKANQRNCMVYRCKGHDACNDCKMLNYEKWRLCHTMPVLGSDEKTPLWKK